MSQPIPIERADDPRIQAFGAVADPALARDLGCFVAEGRLVVRRVVESGRFRVRSLLLSQAALADLDDRLGSVAPEPEVFVAGREIFRRVTGFNIHRGCLALVERPAPLGWRDLIPAGDPARLVVVLEAVANPDNIGGVFRNAAAFGVAAVLLDPACSDPLYRKAVRTSMGASLSVPFATIAPWPAALDEMRRAGWMVAALTPGAAETLESFRARRAAGRPVALVAGHEGHGLSDAALRQADVTVSIPMAPGVESLNLAVATGIALYRLTAPQALSMQA